MFNLPIFYDVPQFLIQCIYCQWFHSCDVSAYLPTLLVEKHQMKFPEIGNTQAIFKYVK